MQRLTLLAALTLVAPTVVAQVNPTAQEQKRQKAIEKQKAKEEKQRAAIEKQKAKEEAKKDKLAEKERKKMLKTYHKKVSGAGKDIANRKKVYRRMKKSKRIANKNNKR